MNPHATVYTKIVDLRPYLKSINCVFIVLEKGAATKTKDEHSIYQTLVADQTGSIYVSLWDQVGEQIQSGDIIRLKGGYCTVFKSSLILYQGKKGTIDRIGEFTMVFSETPNMSAIQWVNDPVTKNLVPVFPNQQPGNQPQQQINNNNNINNLNQNFIQSPNMNQQGPMPPLLPPLLPPLK